MARGFGSTLGSGTTDNIDTGINTSSTNRTWVVRINRNGAGGGTFGRAFELANGATIIENLGWDNTSSQIVLNIGFTTTNGTWRLAGASATNSWLTLAVSYNGGVVAGSVVAYSNGSVLTVTLSSPPVGTRRTADGSNNLLIGNNPATSRNWDGRIAEFAVYDRVLSVGEMISTSDPSLPPLSTTREGLIYYNRLIRDARDEIRGRTQTITGTAVQPHPRVLYV